VNLPHHVNSFLALGRVKLVMLLQLQSLKSQREGRTSFPRPAAAVLANTAQRAVGHLCCKGSLLALGSTLQSTRTLGYLLQSQPPACTSVRGWTSLWSLNVMRFIPAHFSDYLGFSEYAPAKCWTLQMNTKFRVDSMPLSRLLIKILNGIT